jgi:hypothetical protein
MHQTAKLFETATERDGCQCQRIQRTIRGLNSRGHSGKRNPRFKEGEIFDPVEKETLVSGKRNPRFKEGEIFDPVEKETLVERELKTRENRRTAQRSWRKIGRQIWGHLKPNTLKRSKLMHIEVPNVDGTAWTKIENKEEVERHLIDRNVEQFSHAGNTPFGYSALGKKLGHTGDSGMAERILNGTLEHECMGNEAIHAIVGHLERHPTIQGILKPIVTTADFQSCFKCVPEKTALSFSGRSVPHYKACADDLKDGLADNPAEIHAAMASTPLETGFCPERWRRAVDIMLEKVPGIARSNKYHPAA